MRRHSSFELRLILSTLIFVCFCCKPRVAVDDSEIKHTFGNVLVARTKPLNDCKAEAAKIGGKYPKSEAYIKAILDDISSRVNRSGLNIFTGYLDPKNFCIVVPEYPGMNASADPSNGLFTFRPELIDWAKSDADVAGIMAHELGHISLNNDGKGIPHAIKNLSNMVEHKQAISLFLSSGALLKDFQKSLKKAYAYLSQNNYLKFEETFEPILQEDDPKKIEREYLQAKEFVIHHALCEANCIQWKAGMDEALQFAREIDDTNFQLKNLLLKYFSKEEIANKAESDVDEVGIEFMARSGWSLEHSLSFQNFLLTTSENMSTVECLELKAVERGMRDHPSRCWRVRNAKSELLLHQKDYDALFNEGRLVGTFSPSLADAKIEIKKVRGKIK